MSDYINKVKTADGQEYDVQDKRIEAIYTQAEKEKLSRVQEVFTTEEKVKLDNIKSIEANDGKLIIDEVKAPTPVAEFDGVKYYHKHEFDLESISGQNFVYYDLLTGEVTSTGPDQPSCLVSRPWQMALALSYTADIILDNTYTSQSFTVVQTQEERTDNTKICLPGCTAYYGFLSEDGKTFISYWNEEGDGAKPVTKISDGENEVNIQDSRVDSLQNELNNKQDKIIVTQEDIGKVVGVNENGELALINAGSGGGTKLYRHVLVCRKDGETVVLMLIKPDNAPFTLDSL